jgi:hypothetical protein
MIARRETLQTRHFSMVHGVNKEHIGQGRKSVLPFCHLFGGMARLRPKSKRGDFPVVSSGLRALGGDGISQTKPKARTAGLEFGINRGVPGAGTEKMSTREQRRSCRRQSSTGSCFLRTATGRGKRGGATGPEHPFPELERISSCLPHPPSPHGGGSHIEAATRLAVVRASDAAKPKPDAKPKAGFGAVPRRRLRPDSAPTGGSRPCPEP